ncbi:M23 family metallopeptidase [Croceicoccus sp. BE223]|uniref:M23 family metallopeptidase n=1 Tax=Croceicoccus sp. BE223 TaxID=2817716 RepID=UPI00286539E0|nr:M23 family metallopeptidase [Croceicoccus sp. BE223]MDR7103406.1 murein DD-endopeptidase MepM/ murein hydrolase activator NlpD [Croceicoccus sp. BE223]
MSQPTVSASGVAGQKRKSRFWPNLRLIVVTALVTSLGWIVLLGYTDSELATETSPKAVGDATGGNAPIVSAADLRSQGTGQSEMEVASNLSGGALRIPVAGVKAADLVDTYTAPRGDRLHNALDIIVPQGTPVLAAAEGRVEKLFVSDDGGNTIYVRSPDGSRMYYYAHLLGYRPGLKEGNFVRAGQPIGTVGATGNANPAVPHLHFQILRMGPGDPWWEGTPINPYPILRPVR